MRKQPRDIETEFVEPEGGFDPKRLSMALRMLVSEKDVIEHFDSLHPDSRPTVHPNHLHSNNHSHSNQPSAPQAEAQPSPDTNHL